MQTQAQTAIDLEAAVAASLEDLTWRIKAGLTIEPTVSTEWSDRIRRAAMAMLVSDEQASMASLEAADTIERERWRLTDPDLSFGAALRARVALEWARLSVRKVAHETAA